MRFLPLLNSLLLSLNFISLISCDSGNVGPCEHTYKEPILHITSIRDTDNNKHLSFVKLRYLKVNGHSISGYYSLGKSYSVVSNDSIFYCNVPFGFVIENGNYEFVIDADGYPSKKIAIDSVNYAILDGGCPSYNDGGKRVDLIIN